MDVLKSLQTYITDRRNEISKKDWEEKEKRLKAIIAENEDAHNNRMVYLPTFLEQLGKFNIATYQLNCYVYGSSDFLKHPGVMDQLTEIKVAEDPGDSELTMYVFGKLKLYVDSLQTIPYKLKFERGHFTFQIEPDEVLAKG
jgi:hypothetical protein